MEQPANDFPVEFQRLDIIGREYPRTRPDGLDQRSGVRGNDVINEYSHTPTIWVPVSPIDRQPFVIGTGGFATVFLAFEGQNTRGRPLAVKLLKKEQGSGTPNGRYRFIEEIYYNQQLSDTPQATFVEYRGFGYLGRDVPPGSDSDAAKREREWVLKGISGSDIDRICGSNTHIAMNDKFLSDHQNLFFVMTAAWCSLEQVLVSNQPLHQSNTLNLSYHPSGSECGSAASSADLDVSKTIIMNTAHGSSYEGLKRNEALVAKIAAIASQLNIADSSSSLEILAAVRRHPSLGPAVSTRILLDTFLRVVNAVVNIHQFSGLDNGKPAVLQFAHRDLKPANFLIQDCSETSAKILLSDLGFLATERNDKTMYNAFGAVREPGALPVGTVMYQAPEQVMSGREVSYELVTAHAFAKHTSSVANQSRKPWEPRLVSLSGIQYLANAIRLRTVGGIQFDPRDRIISKEISLEHGGDGGRMLIENIISDPAYPTSIIALIAQFIEKDQTPRAEYKGTLVKPVGQQSDLFSLGCLAYFMASGGKDPSEFYRTYLRPPTGLVHLDANAPSESCFDIAMFLARRNGALSDSRELRALFAARKMPEWSAFVKAAIARSTQFQVSTKRDYFLFSTDDQPIGIVFLNIIVALMCRDIEGAYVHTIPRGSADTLTKNSSSDLSRAASRVEAFVTSVLNQMTVRYAKVLRNDPFPEISPNGLDALLKVRLLAPPAKTRL